MRFCLLVALVLIGVGTAEAKPRKDADATNVPAPEPVATAAPVVTPVAPVQPQGQGVEVKFAEGVAFSSSEQVDDLRRAALLLAEVMATGDERYTHSATARFNDVLKTLLIADPAKAAEVAVTAWQLAKTNPAFTTALRTVFTQLDTQGVGTVTLGGDCEGPGKKLEQLVAISEHIGEATRNAYWRGAKASHLRMCSPTPERLQQAYALYVGLGDEKRKRETAEELGGALLARFSGANAAAWQVIDFTKATEAFANAGWTKEQVVTRLGTLAKQAERAKQYRAAEEVYRFMGDATNAEIMKQAAELRR